MASTTDMHFGNLVVQRNLATTSQVKECFAIQQRLQQPAHIGAILVKKGYLSEQHARSLLALQRQEGSGTGTSRGPGSTQAASRTDDSRAGEPSPDQILGQAILARVLLSRERLEEAFNELRRYKAAGHGVTLGQLLVQRGYLSAEQVRPLIADPSSSNVMASGPQHAVAPTASCVACGSRSLRGGQCQACGASNNGYQNSGYGAGSAYGAQASGSVGTHAASPYGAPGVNASGGYVNASGAFVQPAGGVNASGPYAQPAGVNASGPYAQPASGYHQPASGYNADPFASGQVPISAPVAAPMPMQHHSEPTNASGGMPLNSGGFAPPPVSHGLKGEVARGPDGAPVECCVSPDDPIALKMPTVKKPDGSLEIVFGPYDILDEIARGGMGIVYRARQRDLKRVVALKLMKDGEAASEKQIRRFRRETEAAAKLQHPNIVAVHEVGCIEGFHFFTMDLIEGDALDIRVKRGDLPTAIETLNCVKEVSEAIHYAHSKKIVHRDLKPANVMMDVDGHPKVTDFGLAKNVDHKSMLTRVGAVVGTPYYMPPEQARGDNDIDARCDVYALGVILYELLTGKLPFHGETTMEVYHKILEEEPKSPREHNSRIPKDVEVITLKAMDKDRSRRYQTAKDLAEDIQRFLDGDPIKARPLGVFGRTYRKAKKNKGAVLIGGLVCLVISFCASLLIYRNYLEHRRDFLSQQRIEWDQYTNEIENQIISARSSISSAVAKTKDSDAQGAQADLEEARRTLGRLPLLINEFTKFNPRGRAGLYYFLLDAKLKKSLFNEKGQPRANPKFEEIAEGLRKKVEEHEILSSEKPAEDDPFGDMEETVYLPCSAEDLLAYLDFVKSSLPDPKATEAEQQELQPFQVESPLPTRNIRELFRDIFRARGDAYQLREDEIGYKKALESYKTALDWDGKSKTSLEIRLEIGRVLARSNDLDGALATFKTLLSESPDFTAAYLERGAIYARMNEFKKAVADYSHVAEKDFEPIDAFLARGRTFMRVGLYERALRDFREVLELKDDAFWGYLERGRAYLKLGNFEEADTDFSEAIDLSASLPEGYCSRADLYFQQRKLTDAMKDYEVALLRNPQYYPAVLGLARVHEWRLEYDKAEQKYREVLDANDSSAERYRADALAAYGRLLALKADPREHSKKGAKAKLEEGWRKARETLDEALKLSPDHIEALASRGRLSILEGKPGDALKDLERALELSKRELELGKQFPQGEDLELDEESGRSAKDDTGARLGTLHSLVGLLKLKSDRDGAQRHFDAATSASKDVGIALLGRGLLLGPSKGSEPFSGSLAIFERNGGFGSRRRDPNKTTTIGEQGYFFKEGRRFLDKAKMSEKPDHFKAARKAFARVIFDNPWHTLAYYDRGRLESIWGVDLDGAVADAAKALSTNPNLRQGHEFRGFLFTDLLPKQRRPGQSRPKALRDYEQSVKDFDKAIELAKLAYQKGQQRPAARKARAYELAHAFYGRGMARFRRATEDSKGEIKEALEDLSRAIEIAPQNADTAKQLRNKILYHELRSKVHASLGDKDAAAKDKTAASGIADRAKEIAKEYMQEGTKLQNKRKYNEAINLFNKSVEFDPGLDTAYYNRGLCYLKIGNFIPGILDFSRALEINARYADQFYNKVYQVNYVVDLKRVMDELNKIVEERPNVSYVIFLRGFFYVAKSEFKDFEEADLDRGINDFNNCLKINPAHITAKTYRGLLWYKKGLFAKAHKDFDTAIAADSESGISYYLKALCYAKQSALSTGETKNDFRVKSVTLLKTAFKCGFLGYDRIKKDDGFEDMRSSYQPFKDLMKGK